MRLRDLALVTFCCASILGCGEDRFSEINRNIQQAAFYADVCYRDVNYVPFEHSANCGKASELIRASLTTDDCLRFGTNTIHCQQWNSEISTVQSVLDRAILQSVLDFPPIKRMIKQPDTSDFWQPGWLKERYDTCLKQERVQVNKAAVFSPQIAAPTRTHGLDIPLRAGERCVRVTPLPDDLLPRTSPAP